MDTSTKLLRERLPAVLIQKLETFRSNVRRLRLQETLMQGAALVLILFLAAFSSDRLWDAPVLFRAVFLVSGMALLAFLGWRYLSKTILSTEEWTGLARLIEKKFPGPGDRLLGILEIGSDEQEWGRSRTLSNAAISQVSAELRVTDFDQALPRPRFQLLGTIGFGAAFAILVLAFVIPKPVGNTALRWSALWMGTERYTFAQPESPDSTIYTARGEDYEIVIPLKPESPWKPGSAKFRIEGRDHVEVPLGENDCYVMSIPGHADSRAMRIRIGDHVLELDVEPKDRSNILKAQADVRLPDYLQRSSGVQKDIRSGSLSLVRDSSAALMIHLDRSVSRAELAGLDHTITESSMINVTLDEPQQDIQTRLRWYDEFGLEGVADFRLDVKVVEDASPGIVVEDLPRTRVILESDSIAFRIQVTDDFGIREVGMEWSGDGDAEQGSKPGSGEKLFASQAPETPSMQLTGTFGASELGIDPQPLKVRFFVSDFRPSAERVYTQEYLFYVLNEDQHLEWMTRQLTRWQQDALLVKTREEQLLRINQELRDLSASQLDDPETRKRIQAQASAEKSNGMQLARLSQAGENLLQEATRNSQFGPGRLENWAEILNILKDISGNRMPSVEDLLKEASSQPQVASATSSSSNNNSSSDSQNKVVTAESDDQNPDEESDSKPAGDSDKSAGPMVGQNRNPASGGQSGENPDEDQSDEGSPNDQPGVPQIVDNESSLQAEDPNKEKNSDAETDTASNQSGGQPSLKLPSTTLADLSGGQPESCPTSEKMTEAVQEQENLLAEFEKVSDELNRILADLEGSTFVKRLKAASRAQTQMATVLSDQVGENFGKVSRRPDPSATTLFEELKQQEKLNLSSLDEIQQDMHAYYQRKQFTKFRNVLDEMQELDPFTGLDIKSEVMAGEVGWSFTMSEFWADTFDRWAEDLVDPASGGT